MASIDDILNKDGKKKFSPKTKRPWDYLNETQGKGPIDQAHRPVKKNHENQHVTNKVVELDPSKISRWAFKDRPENELGDIEELAQSFKEIGQQVPCIVRPSEKNNNYTLIAGERRWRAASLAGCLLKVIVKDNLTDRQAGLIQAAENTQRKDLSDYARGINFASMIESGVIQQKDLIETLQISKQQVSRLLSFRKIPEELVESFKDLSKISSRTSEEIVRLSRKGPEYIDAIKGLSEKISSGKIAGQSLGDRVFKIVENLQKNTKQKNKQKEYSNGRHIFTLRRDNNFKPSIHFPTDILRLIDTGKLSLNQITADLNESITTQLDIVKSPRGD